MEICSYLTIYFRDSVALHLENKKMMNKNTLSAILLL
jgi:hypothetical protein